MTDPARPAGGDVDRCFEVFKLSAFRLETLGPMPYRTETSGCGPSGWAFPGPGGRRGQTRGCAASRTPRRRASPGTGSGCQSESCLPGGSSSVAVRCPTRSKCSRILCPVPALVPRPVPTRRWRWFAVDSAPAPLRRCSPRATVRRISSTFRHVMRLASSDAFRSTNCPVPMSYTFRSGMGRPPL